MRPHPRIRKTVKWGGAVVSVLFAVLLVVSWRYFWSWSREGGPTIIGLAGTIAIDRRGNGQCWMSSKNPWFAWRPVWDLVGIDPQVSIPLWIPFGAALLITAAAWCLDALARRRARIGRCTKCNYSRTGLAPGAVCPECGAAAMVPTPAVS